MEAESNADFYRKQTFGSTLNRHFISFQSSAMDRSSEMIMPGNHYGTNSSGAVIISGNYFSSPESSVTQSTYNVSSILLESVPDLKHEAGFSVEWSAEEQYRLEEGLVKYGAEPSITRYIEIAAMLHDKTVRDVALRCRWMTRKRRKHDELKFGKKVKDRKNKFAESFSKSSTSLVCPLNVGGYSFKRNHQDGTGLMSLVEASNGAKYLLRQNNEAFGRISANLSTLQLEDNIDLFCRTRDNITAILNNMSNTPGMMSRMPALPLSINNELANSILPGTSQTMMFGVPNVISAVKQETRLYQCDV